MPLLMDKFRTYSVVILPADGSVISRNSGSDLDEACAKAQSRREDFPDALGVRVVCSQDGVIAEF